MLFSGLGAKGLRQGNDAGTLNRSALYTTTPAAYQRELLRAGHGAITTEVRGIEAAGPLHHAEGYHQQSLREHPDGPRGPGGTGVSCAAGRARKPGGQR